MAFTHLHLHTQYSLLQGCIRIEPLFQRVQELSMKALAITDSHNLFGVMDFYFEAKKAGIKPIIGCEIFYIPEPSGAQHAFLRGGRDEKLQPVHHLVLLCKNLKGYQNLCQMLTASYAKSSEFHLAHPKSRLLGKTWVDQKLLNEWGDELIVLSGCLKGELPYYALMKEETKAYQCLDWFQKRFKENFFLEIQDTQLPEQEEVNEVLAHWGEQKKVPLVATSDCHYLSEDSAEAHEVLQCIEGGKNLSFDRQKSLVPHQYFLKSEQAMRSAFSRYPEACDTSNWIAEQCNLEFQFKDAQGKKKYHLPVFFPGLRPDPSEQAEEGFKVDSYFERSAQEGLQQRFREVQFAQKRLKADWPLKEQEYQKRLQEEIQMILKTGFAGYFLIVSDFIRWAKKQEIPVGPGRGSGAGSLVAYALDITDVDPLEFQLLFERFINPERISMPDFDIDFCQNRRSEVIEYVAQKYGSSHVCQIITFGKLQARAVIKDVGRVLGLSFSEVHQFSKLLPEELDLTLEKALRDEPRIKERMQDDPRFAQIMDYALKLEGLSRNAGVHAAGVIITEQPVVSYCPLYLGKLGDWVTQFDKDFAESIGLIKFDFLGLKTLTVIDNAVQIIRSSGKKFAIQEIDYQDPKVFALISSGDTDGVFQLESSGMKDLCCRIIPNNLEDITAINALYRPGPLGSGMVDDFIDRKHGRKPIVYDVPQLALILKDTYGVILYQEQVMQIARELAGYSLGQADLLRRAMGKKKADEMAQQKEIFVAGALKLGTPAEKAQSIFDLMAKFAEYGFNKSHSAAYGILTYQTAYLKTHYPAEFMTALMTTEMDHTEKITKYIRDAKEHGIRVLPPDVNLSQRKFSVEAQSIRFGLEGIKGVGGIAVDTLLEARQAKPFSSLMDFCERVSTRKVNKKVLEALCQAGALDSLMQGATRASVFAACEKLLEHGSKIQQEQEMGQVTLFDALQVDYLPKFEVGYQLIPKIDEWPASQKLRLEKEVVGFFISGHPLDPWENVQSQWLVWNTELLKQEALRRKEQAKTFSEPVAQKRWGDPKAGQFEVEMLGLLGEVKEITTKKGSRMAFGQFEDQFGKIEVVFFPEAYQKCGEFLKKATVEAEVILIRGEVQFEDDTLKLFAKNLEGAMEAHQKRVRHVQILLPVKFTSSSQLRELKQHLLQSPGPCSVSLFFYERPHRIELKLPDTLKISALPRTLEKINSMFGQKVVRFH